MIIALSKLSRNVYLDCSLFKRFIAHMKVFYIETPVHVGLDATSCNFYVISIIWVPAAQPSGSGCIPTAGTAHQWK